MTFSILNRVLIRCSRGVRERNFGNFAVVHNALCGNYNSNLNGYISPSNWTSPKWMEHHMLWKFSGPSALLQISQLHIYPKHALVSTQQHEECHTNLNSDDQCEKMLMHTHTTMNERGNSEFWRRKMCTLHRIFDVNRDGVIAFEDFKLLTKRFTDLGHLPPAVAAEFQEEMKDIWEEMFGPVEPYNLVIAEQFLTDLHHRLNDKEMEQRIGRFLPYLFKAVDYDHNGHLNLDQYKLFFHCLGLTDEDAAISFAAIDSNDDGQISLKEFANLGREYFLTEDETKLSKMFWGPLIDH